MLLPPNHPPLSLLHLLFHLLLRSDEAQRKEEEEFAFPAPSSPAKDSGKREGRPDDLEKAKKRKKNETENEKEEDPAPPLTVVCSYRMLECPRGGCSKQYKEEAVLRWHLSHSHPEYITTSGTVEREQEERKRRARARREVKAEEMVGGAPTADKVPKTTESVKLAGTPLRPAAGTPKTPRLPGQLPAGLIAKSKVPEAEAGPSQPPTNPLLEEVKWRGADVASLGPPSPPAIQEKPPASSSQARLATLASVTVTVKESDQRPKCPRCEKELKIGRDADSRNHVLSHVMLQMSRHLPDDQPFSCPRCKKPHRDKVAVARHLAFYHWEVFDITDITPDELVFS